MKSSYWAILVYLISSTVCHGEYTCVHDTLFKDVQIKSIDTAASSNISDRLRNLQSGARVWRNIRIKINYDDANAFINRDESIKSKYEIAIRQVDSVKRYFERYLMVNSLEIVSFNGGTCYKTTVPKFNDALDLYVTLYPENDSTTDYFAAATTCYTSIFDNRPIIGAYILNFASLKNNQLNDFIYFSTFAHEFTHILGFSDDLFSFFVDPVTKRQLSINEVVAVYSIGSETFKTIILPQVRDYARSYFNCPTLAGLPLENGGGSGSSGSHWEKLFLPLEYMNPTVENPGILSTFTFKLLEGTGWYQVSYEGAQYYDWAKNVGCGQFSICPTSAGYCNAQLAGETVCSNGYTSKGTCTTESTFSSGCSIQRSLQHTCLIKGVFVEGGKEAYGPGSRCLNYRSGSGSTSQCQMATCTANGIEIKVGANTVTCLSSESLQRKNVGLTYDLECPNYTDFCDEFSQKCPQDCNANGLCLNSKSCFCYTGWNSVDCSSAAQIDYNKITSGFSGNKFSIIIVVTLGSFASTLLAISLL